MRHPAPYSVTPDLRGLGSELGLNQQQFWSVLGVTQSGGSRYESGRSIPLTVADFFRLIYVERIDIERIKRDDRTFLPT